MAENLFHSKRYDELRKKADNKLKKFSASLTGDITPKQLHDLLLELHTHQIELELQNEELRLAQIEIDEYRQRFSDLYDFAPVGYLTISSKGLIIEANLTAYKILEIERETLINQSFSKYIPSEDHHIYYQSRRSLVNTRKEQNCELRLRKYNGDQLFALLKMSINHEIDGDSGQHRIILIDITARKEIELAVIRSKREWQETFDATEEFITIQDKNFRIIRANKAAHDLFGAQFGELNGQHCYELFKGTSSPCKNCLLPATAGGKKCFSEEFICESIGKTIHFSASPILNNQNQIEKIVHVGRDITGKKAIEEEIIQSKKMEATITLAGGIAHNFNNILTSVLGNHELALKGESLHQEVRNYIEAAQYSAKKAAELSGMMLQFVGQKKTMMQQIEVNSFIEEIVDTFRSHIHSQINLTCIENIEIFINSDVVMIREMITNLITNAAEAIGESPGEITLEIHQKYYTAEELNRSWQIEQLAAKEYVSITVTDTGEGMTNEDISRAFDPFFSKKFTGRGLGLATVLGIIRAHRGAILLTSKPNFGTTATVLLPALSPEKMLIEKSQEVDLELGFLTGKILVVDDDPILLKLLTNIFNNIGLKVLLAGNGIEAYDIYIKNRQEIDLILLDVAMPKLDGIDTMAKIREESEVPVIIMTGYSLELISADFTKFSNCSFLQKPFNVLELKHRIQDMMG